ncbi:MAG: hypothetical protein GXO87_03555 [Chlorobi bacterium]|nr:hypothetical protein [Chlorobiota bacterium]
MFEREIKFIYDFNLNRVKKIGSFVSYGQLIKAELHPAILQYISAEIDFLIFEDRQKLLKNSVFDYSGEKISKLFSQIDEEIKLNKKFSIEYVNKLLLHSTSFIINYLMRPRWTMIKFLFNDEEDKSAAEIKQVIKYIYFYGYLKDTLVSYLDKKRIVTIKKNELEDLILKIDLLGMDSYLQAILEEAVRSMAGFFNIGTVQTNKVSLLAVKIFLKEKELTNHIAKLNEVYGEDNKQKVEIDELLLALKGVEYEPSEAFDLNLPTEQIEEDELERREIPEFETVEEPEDETIDEYEPPSEEQTVEETKEEETFTAAETFPDSNENDLLIQESSEESSAVDETAQDEIAGVKENDVPAPEETVSDEEPFEEDEEEFEEEEDNLLLKEVDERTKEAEPPFEEIFKDESQTLVVEREEKEEAPIPVEGEKEEPIEAEEKPEAVISEEENDFEPLMEKPQQSYEEINETADEISGISAESDNEPEELFNEEAAEAKSTLDDFEELNDEKKEIDLKGFDEIIRESPEKITPPEEYFSEKADEYETSEEDAESYAEEIDEETTSSPADVFKEMESDLGLGKQDEKTDEKSNEEIVENLSTQPQLFDETDLEIPEMETGFAADESGEIPKSEPKEKTYTQIDISELLHNKNMTKILKVIFDHDMQDFADTIEQISDCGSLEHAEEILDTLFRANHIKSTSKEAVAFKEIIQEYFERK